MTGFLNIENFFLPKLSHEAFPLTHFLTYSSMIEESGMYFNLIALGQVCYFEGRPGKLKNHINAAVPIPWDLCATLLSCSRGWTT